jgi:CheY-like chemotaxis protein
MVKQTTPKTPLSLNPETTPNNHLSLNPETTTETNPKTNLAITPETTPGRTPRILLVEDEPSQTWLIQKYFQKEIRQKKYEFIVVTNGEEACRFIEQDSDLDLIITDLKMPVMDGLELLEYLKQKKIFLKCFVISAYGDLEVCKSLMRKNAYDFLAKPFTMPQFQQLLDDLLQESPRVSPSAREIKGLGYPTIVRLGKQLSQPQIASVVKELSLSLEPSQLQELKQTLETHYYLAKQKEEELENKSEKGRFVAYLEAQINQGLIKSPVPVEQLRKVRTFTLEERFFPSGQKRLGPYYKIRFTFNHKLQMISLKSDPRPQFPHLFSKTKASQTSLENHDPSLAISPQSCD